MRGLSNLALSLPPSLSSIRKQLSLNLGPSLLPTQSSIEMQSSSNLVCLPRQLASVYHPLESSCHQIGSESQATQFIINQKTVVFEFGSQSVAHFLSSAQQRVCCIKGHQNPASGIIQYQVCLSLSIIHRTWNHLTLSCPAWAPQRMSSIKIKPGSSSNLACLLSIGLVHC